MTQFSQCIVLIKAAKSQQSSVVLKRRLSARDQTAFLSDHWEYFYWSMCVWPSSSQETCTRMIPFFCPYTPFFVKTPNKEITCESCLGIGICLSRKRYGNPNESGVYFWCRHCVARYNVHFVLRRLFCKSKHPTSGKKTQKKTLNMIIKEKLLPYFKGEPRVLPSCWNATLNMT